MQNYLVMGILGLVVGINLTLFSLPFSCSLTGSQSNWEKETAQIYALMRQKNYKDLKEVTAALMEANKLVMIEYCVDHSYLAFLTPAAFMAVHFASVRRRRAKSALQR